MLLLEWIMRYIHIEKLLGFFPMLKDIRFTPLFPIQSLFHGTDIQIYEIIRDKKVRFEMNSVL